VAFYKLDKSLHDSLRISLLSVVSHNFPSGPEIRETCILISTKRPTVSMIYRNFDMTKYIGNYSLLCIEDIDIKSYYYGHNLYDLSRLIIVVHFVNT